MDVPRRVATAVEPQIVDGIPAYTVAQFGPLLKSILRGVFPDGVWIEGEVEGLKPTPHSTGHYFSLVDGEGKSKSKLDVKLFANSGDLARVMRKMSDHGIPLANGMRVRFLCDVDFYSVRGELNLIIKDVDTQFTLGDIAKKRDELIARILAAGTDKKNKSRIVPLVPLRLGVVSSLQAAGFIDARRHLEESGIGFELSVCDVNVQGEHAPQQIVAALRTLDAREDIDVILVMRGGGSKGDLAAFDEESVAMTIASCAHPVFTGIGHEIDTSVADIVAHTSFKTPTAVADDIIRRVEEFLGALMDAAEGLSRRTDNAVLRARTRLVRASDTLGHRPMMVIAAQRHRLAMHENAVRLLDPVHTLARGWSITRDERGRVVRSVADVQPGSVLTTTVADGTVASTVTSTATGTQTQ